ncbi:dihydrolipoamide dehydrogenase [Alkalibacillus filiformis]|uniref:Dihydrolipoyl dehydrogenase n=1 Tax=Alkalibacillus filiformis TaxID=200990 RepID=A0ABU0DSP3_9BACI|nr:dihydrolipoyl dehydrogenase [Alkalibacillus filiformis]MDQ0351395.1 dihydrolipoamide dehydrogenase [Alkalibacillus filiformis]
MVVGEITEERDLVVIGGGPGGYTAAIRAAQLGLNVSLVEQSDLGGICLNEGCIPSKVWTYASKKINEISHMQNLGVGVDSSNTVDLNQLQQYKSQVTTQLRKGVESLLKTNQIEVIQGTATFTGEQRIGVENGHQFDHYIYKNAIIATGSQAVKPNYFPINSEKAFLAEKVFQIEETPEHLVVSGFDYLALEVASVFHSFGTKVTLVTNDDDSSLDADLIKELKRLYKKKKIHIVNQATINLIDETEQGITVNISKDGEEQQIEATHCYVSGERKPNIDSLGLERLGVRLTETGHVAVDHQMKTSTPNIYAIGDLTEGEPLAVKAIKQGKVAAEAVAGENPEADLTFLPFIAHTNPPIASVGLTEQQAQANEIHYKVGQFNLGANGYALITGKRDGFVKVISDANTDIILGVHMIGEGAVEMSSHFVQLLEMAAKTEDLTFPHYAHPSMNEGLVEAVEALVGQSIHTPPKKQKQSKVFEKTV